MYVRVVIVRDCVFCRICSVNFCTDTEGTKLALDRSGRTALIRQHDLQAMHVCLTFFLLRTADDEWGYHKSDAWKL